MSTGQPRQFHVPKALQTSSFGPTTTLDEMEFVSTRPNEAGRWAAKVLARENDKVLDQLLGDEKRLPLGVMAAGEDHEVVIGLINSRGEMWQDKSWQPVPAEDQETVLAGGTLQLDDEDVAYVARALNEGADGVVLNSSLPLAFLTAATAAPAAGITELPEGSVPVAIIDALDKDAVLELLAISPGPKAYRRINGQWYEDDAWVHIVGSVTPPPMVKLDEGILASVIEQVDESTANVEFEAMTLDDSSLYTAPLLSSVSSYMQELEQERLDSGVKLNMALLAVAGRELSPKDIKNTEQLRRYWLYGKGAAKIRWFTPGAWRRCYRNVVKYMGPKMAPGYCTNLSQRLGGPGVATHVGSKRG